MIGASELEAAIKLWKMLLGEGGLQRFELTEQWCQSVLDLCLKPSRTLRPNVPNMRYATALSADALYSRTTHPNSVPFSAAIPCVP